MAVRLESISRCFFASAAAFSRALRWTSRSLAAILALASRPFFALAAAIALALATASFLAAAAFWVTLRVATFFTGLAAGFLVTGFLGAGFLVTVFFTG